MNWFRGDPNAQRSQDNDNNNGGGQSTEPDANELRRRRLAKLEEAQAAEKARKKELEERKAAWLASKATEEASNPPPPKPAPAPPRPPPTEPEPPKIKQKRAPPPLPSVEEACSLLIAKTLGIALTPVTAVGGLKYIPELLDDFRQGDAPVVLTTDVHADDILLNRINTENDVLKYIFECYERCGQQSSTIHSNPRISGEEHKQRRETLEMNLYEVRQRVLLYAGMVLNGAFMERDEVKAPAFAELLATDAVPGGFVKALLTRYAEDDGPGLSEILPYFAQVFQAVRIAAIANKGLSARNFLNPLKALKILVSHKELCQLLVSKPTFLPKLQESDSQAVKVQVFMNSSFLCPFFKLSALPGMPVGQPAQFPEDPQLAASLFPNPSMMNGNEAEAAIISLRSSLSVVRTFLSNICLALCKGGPASKNAMLQWFATVCNLNKKRTAMQPDPREISRDGFMFNVMHVLLHLCDPIVAGGWKRLEKVDPTYPQNKNRIDYEDETRLAADTNMLNRWWVDQRNENAQESLLRQQEVAAREASIDGQASSSIDMMAIADGVKPQKVANDFNFITECFWLCLRSIQLTFISVVNMYDDNILRILQRIRDIIQEMERAQERGTLPPNQVSQLSLFRARRESILQTKICYDIYLRDKETLSSLVRFVTADAEWLMKKLLMQPKRESLLPLPTPPDPTFASLPEHTVETITTVLLTTMRYEPQIVDDNSALLYDIVSFCIAGSASPLHVKNPYLRAKLIEFLWTVFPRSNVDDDDNESGYNNPAMETLFTGHELSRQFLPGSLFRLYVDVEHTGSHTQFYDKFSIRYRIGSILESLWYMPDYRKSVRKEASDQDRFLRFINMVLNDANHLLDSALDNLEEIHGLQMLMNKKRGEWEALSDEEKNEKMEHLQKLEGQAKGHNQLANNNVKLFMLLTDDEVVRKVFLRPEMVSRMAEMLNYLLNRLCGKRCSDLVVSEPEKFAWEPRKLLTRIIQTYIHFHGNDSFSSAVGNDGRSYSANLFERAIGIAKGRKLISVQAIRKFEEVATHAARALEEENAEEEDLGDIPEEFLDPIMSSLMRDPVRLPTSDKVMDRSVISRILLSDKADPFNRRLLTEDMLEEDKETKRRIQEFIKQKKAAARNKGGSSGS